VCVEFVLGGSLKDLAQKGKIPVDHALKYAKDILHGLQYIHSKDIVHRDLKPQNILLTQGGNAKIADFGCARWCSSRTTRVEEISDATTALSGTDTMVSSQEVTEGTPVYMAPEAADGRCQASNDIWSFGITLLEVISGRNPWKNINTKSTYAFLHGIAKGINRPFIPSDLQPEVVTFITRILDCNAQSRASASEALCSPVFLMEYVQDE
jgi:serine/threonine protein kinase